jgi:hypothetical protein
MGNGQVNGVELEGLEPQSGTNGTNGTMVAASGL